MHRQFASGLKFTKPVIHWIDNTFTFQQNSKEVGLVRDFLRLIFSTYSTFNIYTSGPGCSKLTTSLVNVLLNSQTLKSRICQYFLLKKCEKLSQCKSFSRFFNKNISVFGYKVVKHFTS